MVGLDGSDATFSTVGNTGGSKDAIVVSHNHTATSTVTDPTHRHYVGSNDSTADNGGNPGNQEFVRDAGSGTGPSTYTNYASTGISVSTSVASTGSSATGANLMPYVVVYLWKRTA
jgi:microcystin-dependent protein